MTDGIRIDKIVKGYDYRNDASLAEWEKKALEAIDPNHDGVISNKAGAREMRNTLSRMDITRNPKLTQDDIDAYTAASRFRNLDHNATESEKRQAYLERLSAMGELKDRVVVFDEFERYAEAQILEAQQYYLNRHDDMLFLHSSSERAKIAYDLWKSDYHVQILREVIELGEATQTEE